MTEKLYIPDIIPVILCGGSGTRLWPISRNRIPKQFLNLMGENSLIQQTVLRAAKITCAPAENLVTITLGAFAEDVRKQLSELNSDYTRNIISEPDARNTAAAIAYGAIYTAKNFGEDTIMWVLPSDHHMGDLENLKKAFDNALLAAEDDYLVTFGIRPSRPETGYGYIKTGAKMEGNESYIIDQFVEKPDKATAQEYLNSRAYFWNSGMFLFKVSAVLSQFEKFAPDILKTAKDALEHSKDGVTPDTEIYGTIEKTPFDIAIMEKTDRAAVVPCDPDWSDIGSWESLWDIRPKDGDGNSISGDALTVSTTNSLIQNNGKRLITTAGLDHIAVVDTGDTLLVVDLRKSQDIKLLVEKLKDTNHKDLLEKFL